MLNRRMKCILHIGTEKTGTTALQRWLYRNESNLSKKGVALTHDAKVPNNRKLVAAYQSHIDDFMKANGIWNSNDHARYFAGFSYKLGKELESKRHEHEAVLITSEHFHSRLSKLDQIAALKGFLDRHFTEYKIICYFREQSKLRTSLYSTALKSNCDLEISEFQVNASTDNHYYNYFNFFRKWEEIFGRNALCPRIYDRNLFVDGDIRADFLQLILPSADITDFELTIDRENESLNQHQAFFFRLINKYRPDFVGRFRDTTPRQLKAAIKNTEALMKGQRLVDPGASEFSKIFEESNREFFRRYFDTDEYLFEQPSAEQSTNRHGLTLNEAEVDELFGQILGNKQLIALQSVEVDLLRDLAIRLCDTKAISRKEAIGLLKIAHRARPDGGLIPSKIEALLKTTEVV